MGQHTQVRTTSKNNKQIFEQNRRFQEGSQGASSVVAESELRISYKAGSMYSREDVD